LTNDLLFSAFFPAGVVEEDVAVPCLVILGRRTSPPGFEGEREANLPFVIDGEPLGVIVVFPDEVEAERLLFDDIVIDQRSGPAKMRG
jgi:hypothetical protein